MSSTENIKELSLAKEKSDVQSGNTVTSIRKTFKFIPFRDDDSQVKV